MVVLVPGLLNDNGGAGEMAGLETLLEQDTYKNLISGVVVAPSWVNPTEDWQLDSDGDLNNDVWRLANWLARQDGTSGTFDLRTTPFVIIGHSYGGVIARGLVSSGSNGTLASTDYAKHPEIANNIQCVIQLGSPNEGSPLAQRLMDPGWDLVAKYVPSWVGIQKSAAIRCMTPSNMQTWNASHSMVSVPIHRAAGSFLPAVLNEETSSIVGTYEDRYIYDYTLTPDVCDEPRVSADEALRYLDGVLGGQASDGLVPRNSVIGDDSDASYKNGGYKTFPELRHASIIPGAQLTYQIYHAQRELTTLIHESIDHPCTRPSSPATPRTPCSPTSCNRCKTRLHAGKTPHN